MMSVADLGEFGLIAEIRALLPPDPSAIVGVGDDAAVLPVPGARVVASTDLLIEGRHFRRDWSAAKDVGAKAAAQNLADIAAMGAVPTALLFGLAIPGEVAADWVLGVTRGMVSECGRIGAAIAGGDVTSADQVMLAITALGYLNGQPPVTRGGARPGDAIAVSGPVGPAAAGLALLLAGYGRQSDLAPELTGLIDAQRRPQPRYQAGPQAARHGATAMIDTSDGLLQDLGHIAADSGVGLELRLASLPGTDVLRPAADLLQADWRQWALAGGEDHAFAATFSPGVTIPADWTIIGNVCDGADILVDGAVWPGNTGWDHFRKPGSNRSS
jgi:thiamine-monophosphate kinase